MQPSALDLYRLAPEIVLCAFGILVMLAGAFLKNQRAMGWLGFFGALAGLASLRWLVKNPGLAYNNLFRVDDFSIFFHALIIGVAALAILGSIHYLDREQLQHGEYYALILFATAGMGVLTGANELVTAFIGLEMSSISSYILTGFRRKALKSNESSLKYFILGSFATAFFLYGIAMVYGASGTTRLDGIAAAVEAGRSNVTWLTLGIALLLIGLGFKVVAAPFHVYAPDVYEGAPTPVTALLSSGPKAAAFALMLRVFFTSFGSVNGIWFWAIWAMAILTMFAGNLAALVQTNVKRMLAYSSIAHAGYILVAFAASTELGIAAVLFYLAAYALMKLGAFTIIGHLGGTDEKRLDIKDYAGLATQQPWIAACFALFLFSLMGLPATGGFLGKFYAFKAALDSRLVWLVVLAGLNSVIGAYYYLRVVVAMYFWEPQREFAPAPAPLAVTVVLFFAAAGTIYLGLFPSAVMNYATLSALSLR
jgi:NADH-quinone oxidoreductase subunit N